MNPSKNSYDVAVVTCILKYIQYNLQVFFYQSRSPLETSRLFAADCIILRIVPSKHVRPNPDVAPHWQASWSSSSSPSSSASHHQIMFIVTLKFATPSEQYVDWGNNINFIFMRGQNSPPPLNNLLVGVKTSTISPWGVKIRHPLWTIKWLGNNISYISMRDQNYSPPMNNMLVGVITSTLCSWGVKSCHPLWTICWLG